MFGSGQDISEPAQLKMRYLRIILACLIALSVVMLPTAGVFATIAQSADVEISDSMSDCCDHGALPCDHGSKDMGDCAAMAACMAKCFNYAAIISAGLPFGPAGVASQPSSSATVVLLEISNPPFRPPPV